MSPAINSRSLALGLLVGLVVGAALGGPLLSDGFFQLSDERPADKSPSWSVSRSGPTCYEGPDPDTGWMHIVATGETWTTTLDATVVHPPGTTVETNITRSATGTDEIALHTVESTEAKPRDENCQLATDITLATAIGEPDVAITMNGRLIQRVEQDTTGPELYEMPNPINAST